MIAFVNVEKLRCARQILKFKTKHPGSAIDTTAYDSFVAANKSNIDTVKAKLWPNLDRVAHWSGRDLRSRVTLLPPPFEEIYDVHYPILSWQVHSGLTGVVNLQAETFILMCCLGFKLAVDSYWETLSAVIEEFRLRRGDAKILGKMEAARMMPFTDNPREAEQLLRELTL